MVKKLLRIAYNVVGVLAALTLPTVFAMLVYIPPYRYSMDSLLYPFALLLLCLLALPATVTLFRKRVHLYTPPLYAATVGFALSGRMTQFLLSFVSEKGRELYIREAGGVEGVTILNALVSLIYSYPLAFLSLVVAILLTVFYLRKKRKAESALTANPTPDSDSSAPKAP